MENCPNCNAEIENNFELCWNCSYSFTEKRIIKDDEIDEEGIRHLDCTRCYVRMLYSGQYKFYQGATPALLVSIFEWFLNRKSFDIYVCPKCGKAEFYTTLT